MAKFDKKFESATVEWPTPQELSDEYDAEFGFALDVAATASFCGIPRETGFVT